MRPTSWPLPARIGAGAIGAWGWGLAYVMRVGPCQGTAGVPCGAPKRRAVSSVHKGCAPWTGTYRGRGWAAMNARAPRLTCANGRRDVAGGPGAWALPDRAPCAGLQACAGVARPDAAAAAAPGCGVAHAAADALDAASHAGTEV